MKLHQNARKFFKIRKFKTFENVKRLGFEFLASYATRMNLSLFQWAINAIYKFTNTDIHVSKIYKTACFYVNFSHFFHLIIARLIGGFQIIFLYLYGAHSSLLQIFQWSR